MVSERLVRPVQSRAVGWLGALADDEPLSQAVRQDASGVHEAALRTIAAVTKQTPDTLAAAALA